MPRTRPPAIKLSQAVEEYFKAYETRDWSKSAINVKRRALTLLCKWAPKREHTFTRNLTDVIFRDALIDAHRGGSDGENRVRAQSGRGKRTGVRDLTPYRGTYTQFAEFLKWKKWVEADFEPFFEINNAARDKPTDPRKKRKLRIIKHEAWPALIDAATHPRDRMAVTAGLFWARRASELVRLTWGDIDRHRTSDGITGWVSLINWKGRELFNHGEPMPMGEPVKAEYDRYRAWYVDRYGGPNPDDWFLPAKMISRDLAKTGVRWSFHEWPLDPSKPTRERTMGELVKRLMADTFGIEAVELFGEGSHALRRAGLSHTAKTAGLEVAQALAGHKSIQTTQIYTKNLEGRERLNAFMAGQPIPGNGGNHESKETTDTGEQTAYSTGADSGAVIDLFSRRRIA